MPNGDWRDGLPQERIIRFREEGEEDVISMNLAGVDGNGNDGVRDGGYEGGQA